MKTKIINYIKTIIGIVLLLFFLYSIIFKHFFNYGLNYVVVITCVILSFCGQLLFLLRNLKVLQKIINKVQKIYQYCYTEPLEYIYKNFVQEVPGLGTFLYSLGKLFTRFCITLGNNATLIVCLLFYVLPNSVIIVGLFYNLFIALIPSKFIYITISFSVIVVRLTALFMFILKDFSNKNMEYLNTFMIIKTINNAYNYEFNTNRIKNPTENKLKFYAERYEVFREINIFTSAFIFFKLHKIDSFFKPLIIATIFICSLKVLLVLIYISINNIIYTYIYLSIILSEYYQKKT